MGISVPQGRGEWFFLLKPQMPVNTSNVYAVLYKRTIDFTDIDYLMVHYQVPASCYIKIIIDGSTIYEETNKNRLWRIDCSSYTGLTTLEVDIKTDVERAYGEIMIWESE